MTRFGNAKRLFMTAGSDMTVNALLAANLPAGASCDQVLASGAVWLDRTRLSDGTMRLAKGQTLRVYVSETQGRRYVLPADRVVLETADFLVVDKPAGLSVASERSNVTWNLTYGVAGYFRAQGLHYEPTPITRLDLMVRGLTLFAKHKAAERELFALSQGRRIGKWYLALLELQAAPPSCLRVRDKLHFVAKAVVSDTEGRDAHSLFVHRGRLGGLDSYSVFIFTGRRHQIRCHASHYLKPVAGDDLYGSRLRASDQSVGLFACGYSFVFRGKRYRVRLPEMEKRLAAWCGGLTDDGAGTKSV